MSTFQRPTLDERTGKWYIATHIDDFFGRHEYGIRYPDGHTVPEVEKKDWDTIHNRVNPESCDFDVRKPMLRWAQEFRVVLAEPDWKECFEVFDEKSEPYPYDRCLTKFEFERFLKQCPHTEATPDDFMEKPDVAVEDAGAHKAVITKHENGRQDVEIQVTRLNLENRTPEDDAAEDKIIDALSKQIVRVVVLHRPSNDSAAFDSPRTEVRKRAIQVAHKHIAAIKRAAKLPMGVDFEEPPLSEYAVIEFYKDGATQVSKLA